MSIQLGEIMKTKECIQCKKFFECPGKVDDKPCLHFKERKKERGGDTPFRRGLKDNYDSSR